MNSLFYCGVERKEIINNFIEKLDRYSEETSRPIYIIEWLHGVTRAWGNRKIIAGRKN